MDDRLAKTICKIYSKLLFDFTSKLQARGSFPVHLILEEAHRYVQNDSDIKVLGYNIFDRIAKEGRKFGLGLIAITQRPSAISEEIRTQAENFFTFHLGNSDDIKALTKSNINFDGVIAKFTVKSPLRRRPHRTMSSWPKTFKSAFKTSRIVWAGSRSSS